MNADSKGLLTPDIAKENLEYMFIGIIFRSAESHESGSSPASNLGMKGNILFHTGSGKLHLDSGRSKKEWLTLQKEHLAGSAG